jgi:hypothetical protein
VPRYPHLLVRNSGNTERYTATSGRDREFLTPDRNWATHAARVLRSLQQAQAQREHFPQRIGAGFYESPVPSQFVLELILVRSPA